MLRAFCLIALLVSVPFRVFSQGTDQERFAALVDSADRASDEENFAAADALLQKAAKLPFDNFPDSLKYDYYHVLAENDFYSGRLENAEKMENIALAIATSIGDSVRMMVSNALLANIKSIQGKSLDAIYHHKKALSLATSEDSTSYYRIINNLSHAYKAAGKVDSAMQMLVISKKFYKREGLIYEQAISEANIGEMYREDFDDFEMARKHYFNSLDLHKIKGGPSDFSRVYHNYAILLGTFGQPDSAEYYFNKSIELRKTTGDVGGVASSLVELGRIYLGQNDFGAAISNFAEALRISEKYGIERGIYYCSLNLADAHAQLGNYRVSLANYDKALEAAKRGDQLIYEMEVNHKMYTLHRDAGQWEAALTSLERFGEISENVDKERRDNALAEIKSRYETELTVNENAALLLEQEMTKRQLEVQRWILIGLILVIVLFLMIGYFLYRAVRQRDAALLEIRGAREDLEGKLEKIELQEKRLLEANEFKNRVISVIGHDLRAPLANIVGILEMIKESDASQDEVNDMFEHLRRETDTNLKSLQNLLEWSRLEEEGLTPARKIFDPRDVAEDAAKLHDTTVQSKNVNIEISGGDKIWADENQFKSVAANLLGNAVKYSPEGGKVAVRTTENEVGYVFSVSDNGGGMPSEVIASLDSRSRIDSKPGTRGERGTGIGLRLVSDFARSHGGELKIVQNESGGTTAEVFFPKPHMVKSADVSVSEATR